MSPDSELLDKARAAAAEFAEAERQALISRAEYHTAVRRLHLAGASLREIAAALFISHQRVQQIVSGAGGSWWRRAWRTRTARPDAVCTWCGRPPSEVAQLIAGPRVYICNACIEAAERAAGRRAAGGPFRRLDGPRLSGRCAFCAKRAGRDRAILAAPAGRLCTDCLRVCREILNGRAG